MNKDQAKKIYSLLAILCAAAGTFALLARELNESALLFWGILLMGANVFTAVAVVLNTRKERIRIPVRPGSPDEKKEPKEAEVYRIPLLPVFASIAAGVATGLATGSVMDGFLVFLTWGMLGYPLAHCILRRDNFGAAAQTGLLVTTLTTLLAGFIHAFKVTGIALDLEYCYDIAVRAVADKLLPAVELTKAVLSQQPATPLTETAATLLFRTQPAEHIATDLAETLALMAPALFTLAVLGALCLIWWITKEILKRSDTVSVGFMGRLDGYVPSRAVTAVYLLSFLLSLIAKDSLWMSMLASNLSTIASTVLLYSGYSLILFIIDTRATSKPLRIILSLLALILAFDSFGSTIILIAGIFNSVPLRTVIGGGTIK